MTAADQERKCRETREVINQIRDTITWLEDHIYDPGGASPLVRRAEIAGYRNILKGLEDQVAAHEAGASRFRHAA